MKKFLLVLMFASSSLFSQKMDWSNSVELYRNFTSSTLFHEFDSEGNILITLDCATPHYEITANEYISYFTKFSNKGETIFNFEYRDSLKYYPLGFFNNNNEYQLFGLGDSTIFSQSHNKNMLPKIININKAGEYISTYYPYDIYAPSNYSNNYSRLTTPKTISLKINNHIYNFFIQENNGRESIKMATYDNAGNHLGIRQLDTCKSISDNLSIRQVFFKDDKIYLLYYKYILSSKYFESFMQIVNETGESQKIIKINMKDSFAAYYFDRLNNGNFMIYGSKTNSNNTKLLLEVDFDGNVVSEHIPQTEDSLRVYIQGLKIDKDDNIFLYGYSKLNSSDPNLSNFNIWNSYLAKYSDNYKKLWDYLFFEEKREKGMFDIASTIIMDIIIGDDDYIYAFGQKEDNELYVAKIDTDINSSLKKEISNSSLYPNPAQDFITISDDNIHKYQTYEISDLMGRAVLSGTLESDNKIMLEDFPAGIYFLKLIGTTETKSMKFVVGD